MTPIVEFDFIPTEPAWSTNQDRNMNPYARHARIQAWQDSAAVGWLTVPPKTRASLKVNGFLPPAIVDLSIPFAQKRRRDPANMCGSVLKAVVDGLVRAGLWPDDTPEWIGHWEPTLIIGKVATIRLYDKETFWRK